MNRLKGARGCHLPDGMVGRRPFAQNAGPERRCFSDCRKGRDAGTVFSKRSGCSMVVRDPFPVNGNVFSAAESCSDGVSLSRLSI